jgi:hypothetical protein
MTGYQPARAMNCAGMENSVCALVALLLGMLPECWLSLHVLFQRFNFTESELINVTFGRSATCQPARFLGNGLSLIRLMTL